ncbi:MAG: metalloregulator ArsR/SmtB family transcription factor [Phycisphaerales bacterium]|nr:ArsR family transcriptional regulator [Planctomycetota bacterium]MCH8507729.1 metalloregulator ArsR/SmtB family transcription factor [Phycisphaerales bacterium]
MATRITSNPNRGITERLAQLGDPARVRMLRILDREELAVGELAKVLQVPQSSASRHLKVLSDGGWLLRRPSGPATYYRVVLDDLPDDARSLWLAVREHADSDPETNQDDARLAAVLAERMADPTGFFGRYAGHWDDLRGELFGRRFTDQALLGLIDPAWTVADLGCGTGNAAELLAPWVDQVLAIDASPEMLDAARRRLPDADNVRLIRADLTEASVEPGSVDAAVCLLVLHHVDDPGAVLSRMREMLRTDRNGGVALVVDITAHDRADYRHEMGHKHPGFTHDGVRSMFEQAGFGDVRVRTLPPDIHASGPALFVATGRIR